MPRSNPRFATDKHTLGTVNAFLYCGGRERGVGGGKPIFSAAENVTCTQN